MDYFINFRIPKTEFVVKYKRFIPLVYEKGVIFFKIYINNKFLNFYENR